MRNLYNCCKVKNISKRKENAKKKVIKNYPDVLDMLNLKKKKLKL